MAHHFSYGRLPGGWVGVDLFFVLSGYLITGILVAELSSSGGIRFGRFYIRRVLRLAPALVATILLTGLFWSAAPCDAGLSWESAATASLLYFANLVPLESMGMLGPCWSLAVEEHYYLAWPPLLLLAWRIGGRATAASLAVAGIAMVVAFRAAGGAGWFGLDSYRFTLTRIDSLLVGSVVALLMTPGQTKVRGAGSLAVLSLVGLLLFARLVDRTEGWLPLGGYTIVAIYCSILVVALTQSSLVAALLSTAPFVWIGRRSYGLYLYHIPVFEVTEVLRERHSIPNAIWVTLLRLGVSFALAAVSYRYLEQPFLKLKDRLAPRNHAADVPSPVAHRVSCPTN